MKIAILFTLCLLIVSVIAQAGPLPVLQPFPFDHVEVQGDSVSLNGVPTNTQFISGANCQVNNHAMTTSNPSFPTSETAAYRIQLDNLSVGTISVPLVMSVFDADGTILELANPTTAPSTKIGTSILCNEGTTCVVDIFCDEFFTFGTWTIQISTQKTDNTDNPDNFGNYVLSAIEEISTVTVIPASRTASGNGIPSYDLATIIGPEDFTHFYHDLQPTIGEDGASSRLFVIADNFSVSGTYTMCLNFATAVAITETPTSSNNEPLNPITDDLGVNAPSVYQLIDNSATSNDVCTNICYTASVDAVTNTQFVFPIDSCDYNTCGFPDELWIGLTSAGGSSTTFTLTIAFRDFSIPDVVNVNANPFILDNEVTDILAVSGCDGEQGEFACEDYYLSSLANSGISAASFDNVHPALGPYFMAELYAVREGTATLEVSQNTLAGDQSSCGAACDGRSCTVNDGDVECYIYVPVCDSTFWGGNEDLSTEFISNVYGEDNLTGVISYAVHLEFGQHPLTVISPDDNINTTPVKDVITPNLYHHYQVDIVRGTNLFDDSRFYVELWENHHDMDVEFYWNFGSPAARVADCGEFQGMCSTNGGGDHNGNGDDDSDTCEFMFYPCPISRSNNDDDDFNQAGEYLSELKEGSYYFSVRGVDPNNAAQFVVQNAAADYTINWILSRTAQIYDRVGYHQSLPAGFISDHYTFDIPNDPAVYGVQLQLSHVHTHELEMYVQCNTFAGDCPCFENFDSCTVDDDDERNECSVTVSTCDCPRGSTLYVSVWAVEQDDVYSSTLAYQYYTNKAQFVITAYTQRVESDVLPLPASRSLELISGKARLGFNNEDYLDNDDNSTNDYDFYQIDFTNVQLTDRDALEVYLQVTAENFEYGSPNYGSYAPSAILWVNTGSVAGDTDDDEFCSYAGNCIVVTGSYYNYFEYSNSILNQSEDGDIDAFGSCTLVFQPCTKDSSVTCFDNDDLEEDDEALGVGSNFIFPAFNAGADEWFASVQFVGVYYDAEDNSYLYSDSHASTIDYQIAAQVKDQTPITLTDGVVLEGFLYQSAYQHYVYNIPTHSANSYFRAEQWTQQSHHYQTEFFMNYAEGDTFAPAGHDEHCYANLFPCSTCQTTDDDSYYCVYQIEPCDFATMDGSFYFSVYSVTDENNDIPFNDPVKFSIVATIFNTEELLGETDYYGLPAGFPVTDNLHDSTSSYYSVTVPPLPSGVRGWILTIEVDSLRDFDDDGELYVKIDQIQPDNQCDCRQTGCVLSSNAAPTENFFRRFPCELNAGDVFYVHIDSDSNGDAYYDVDYVIHAKLDELLEVPIALGPLDPLIDTTQFNLGYFDSADQINPIFEETVVNDQFKTFSFTRSDPLGSELNIEVFQEDTLAAQQSFAVYLSTDEPVTSNGDNGVCGTDIGPLADQSNCVAAVATCVPATYNQSGTHCFMRVPACANPDTSTTWYITVDGTTVGLNSSTENLHIIVNVQAADNSITVPATTDFVTQTVINVDVDLGNRFDNYGNTQVRSANAISIPAATSLTIAYTAGPGTIDVDFGTDCPTLCTGVTSCTIVACNAINDFIYVSINNTPSFGGPSNLVTGTLTFDRFDGPNEITGASSVNSNQVLNIPQITNNDWTWITFNNPSSLDGDSHWEARLFNGDILNDNDLNIGGGNVAYTTTSGLPVNMPGLENYINTFGPNPRTETGTNNCGAFDITTLPEETCCFEAGSTLVGLSGTSVGDAIDGIDATVDVIDFRQSLQTIGSSANPITATITGDRAQWYTFNLPANSVLYYEFDVIDDGDLVNNESAELYINFGAPAGSDLGFNFDAATGGDYASCFSHIDSLPNCQSSEGAGDDSCEEFFDSCDGSSSSCIQSSLQQTVFFTVIPTGNQDVLNDVTFQLQVVSVPNTFNVGAISSTTSTISFTNGIFPPQNIVSELSNTQTNAPYSHYTVSFDNFDYHDIPQFLPLTINNFNILEDYYPHIEIIMPGLTQDGLLPVDNLQFFYSESAADSICGFTNGVQLNTAPNGVCDFQTLSFSSSSGYDDDFGWVCAADICNYNCGSEFYISVSQNSNIESIWRYSLQVQTVFNQVTTQVAAEGDVFEFVNFSAPGVLTIDETNFVEPADEIWVRVNPAGLNNVDWYYFEASVENEYGYNDNVSFDIEFYGADQCYSTQTAALSVSVNTPLDRDGTETDPCTSSEFYNFDAASDVFYMRFERTDGGNTGYRINFEIVGVTDQVIEATITNDNDLYDEVKEIVDFEWHIFEFDIEDNGYNWLQVTVDTLCCFQTGAQLEIFYSWEQTGADMIDVARPSPEAVTDFRIPSGSCNVFSDTITSAAGSTNHITDFCVYYGGHYRISIWAPENTQLFSTGLARNALPSDLVFVPVTYHITVSLNEMPHRDLALECEDTQIQSGTFVPRYELITEAENRGTQLEITFALPDGGAGTLFVADSAHPFSRLATPDLCAWDDDEYYHDSCTLAGPAADSCTITLSPCQWLDTTFYLYTDVAGVANGDRVVVGSQYDRKYIPVVDGVNLLSQTFTGLVTQEYYQYYTVDVDPTDPLAQFTAQITNMACTGCTFNLYGISGFESEVAADCSNDKSCNTGGAAGSSCAIRYANCYPDTKRSVYYLGVTSDDDDDQCKYQLDITTQATVVDIQDGVLNCDSVCDADHFRVVNLDLSVPDLRESTVQVTIDVLGGSDLQLAFKTGSVPGVGQQANPQCEQEYSDLGIFVSGDLDILNTPVTFEFSCISGDAYLAVFTDDDLCSGPCDGVEYTIQVDIISQSVTDITTTSAPASGYVHYAHPGETSSWTYISSGAGSQGDSSFDAISADIDNSCHFSDCDDDQPGYPNTPNAHNGRILLDHNVANDYYFNRATGLTLDTLTTSQMTTITTTGVVSVFPAGEDSDMIHYIYTPSANADTVTFFFDEFDACSCDLGSDDLSDLDLYIRSSSVAPPFDGCWSCSGSITGDDDVVQIVSSACDNQFSYTVNCPDNGDPIYLSVSSCTGQFTCDVSYSVTAFETSTPRTTIGGDHNQAYTVASFDFENCGDIETNVSFFVDVTDILSVSLREPHSSAGDLTATVTITEMETGIRAGCSEVDACSVSESVTGNHSSCRVDPKLTYDDDDTASITADDDDESNSWSCAEPRTYKVDVAFAGSDNALSTITGGSVELQVVNSWVTLSGSASNSIIGKTRHFYEVPTAADGALTFTLDIEDGPSLEMYVFDGCDKSIYRDTEFQWFASNDDDDDDDYFASSALTQGGFGDLSFREYLKCGNGQCHVYIPTPAKQSNTDAYYVIIASGESADDDDGNIDSVHQNSESEKETFYTLSVTSGSANCAAVPSTGFCASTAEADGSFNVFSQYTGTSVWLYDSDDRKNDEADCRYRELLGWCPTPSDQCKRWLKTFSCLESFPQCDTNGYILGQCQEVCDQIEIECGTWLSNDPRFENQCWSGRYVRPGSEVASSCVTIPEPYVAPPLDDDALDYDDDTVVPDLTLEIPIFSPITVQVIESGNNNAQAGNAEFNLVENVESSASTISISVLLVLAIVFALL